MFELRQTEHFEKWFFSMRDKQAQRRIAARLSVIREVGHFGDFKPVGHDVLELRFHFGPGYRVYYTVRGETIVLLLAGGDKSSQQRDISKAIELAGKA